MTEPQGWVLIGMFAASTFGMIAIISVSFTRTLTAAVGGVRSGLESGLRGEIAGLDSGLRGEISGLRDTMDARFELVDARFEAFDAKFSNKFDALHRDIQALSRRMFDAE